MSIVAGLKFAILPKKGLYHRCFLVNIAKFPRKAFSQLLLICSNILETFHRVIALKIFKDNKKNNQIDGKRTKGHLGKCLNTMIITIHFVENF